MVQTTAPTEVENIRLKSLGGVSVPKFLVVGLGRSGMISRGASVMGLRSRGCSGVLIFIFFVTLFASFAASTSRVGDSSRHMYPSDCPSVVTTGA